MLHRLNNKNPRHAKGSINDESVPFFDAYSIENPDLRKYQSRLETIPGWFLKLDLKFLDWLTTRNINTEGGVMELGVHTGKMFIAMNMTVESGESYAVDIFDDKQDYNVSHSGGDCVDQEKIFRTFLQTYDNRWQGKNVKVITEDTMMLTTEHFDGNMFKLISIDAGHHKEHVVSDLRLCENLVARDGVVAVDDWMSNQWPGVTEGTIEYLRSGKLVPFASYHNKLYLCRYNSHYRWMYEMERFKYKRNAMTLCGYDMYDICETYQSD